MKNSKVYLATGIMFCFALTARADDAVKPATAVGAEGAATAPATAASPSDPQTAQIVVTANQVDIDAGKLAKKVSRNKEVKKFAADMIRDHESVNKQAKALVKKLKVTPESSDTSTALAQGGTDNMTKLKGLKGADFDRAYADNEVAYHEKVIAAVKDTLIPAAKNEELKALLEKVAPVLDQHLEHAKHLQASLTK